METGEAIKKHIKRLTDADLSLESIAHKQQITDDQALELSEGSGAPSQAILDKLITIQTPSRTNMNDSELKLELAEIAAAHNVELVSSDTAKSVKDKIIALAAPPLSLREKKYVMQTRDSSIKELKLSGRIDPTMHNFLVANYADQERVEKGDIVLSESADRTWEALIEFAAKIPEGTFSLSETSRTGIQSEHVSLSFSETAGEHPVKVATEKRKAHLAAMKPANN